MRKLLMGFALPLIALQALCWGQTSTPEWQRCWSKGTSIPAETRIENCTNLIERGEKGEFPIKLLAIAYSNRGIAYRDMDLTDQAISDFTKAIGLNSDLDVAYYNRGNAYGRKGLYDQAVADYTKSIEIAPDHAAYTNRAWAHEKKGERDQAINDYRAALKLDPNDKFAKDALQRLGVPP
jgi:tetratricopeptide (TPR) repeat protein